MAKKEKAKAGRSKPAARKANESRHQPAKPSKAAKVKKTSLVRSMQKPEVSPVSHARQASEGKKPRCLVLAGFGLNSEAELAHAFSLAGAEVDIVHFSDIASGEKKLSSYHIFAIPGGWSFADQISSGRVLSNKLKSTFRRDFEEFAQKGKPIIGICNGFQVLVKLGALPNFSFSQESTLTANESGKFEDRWVYLKPQKSVCKYFEGVELMHCPVRHGEGRFLADRQLLDSLEKKGMVVVKYSDSALDDSAGYPYNPNGSSRNIAGICDPTGKIFALMPHPECSVDSRTHPRFLEGISSERNSRRFFENVVKAALEFAD